MSFTFSDRIDYKDTAVADAYRRLRVSAPYGIFNSSLQSSINTDDWETVTSGTASATYLPVQSAATLEVGTSVGDRLLRQSLRTFQYQTGTGTHVMMTGVLGAGKTGVSSRIGIYDDDNGIFFEVKDGVFGVVLRRTLTSGNTENIRVEQSSFNKDTLDGTGPSGYNIDTTKAQIFSIDYAWLGVGRVRISVWKGSCFCTAHEFAYNNIMDSAYMGKGDLPVRYEIINNTATASATSMKQICSAVFVEGGLNPSGYARSAFTNPSGMYSIPKDNDWYHLLTVRIKSGNKRISIGLNSVIGAVGNSDPCQFAIFKNATTPPLTYQDASDYTEFAYNTGVVTGGSLIISDIGAQRATSNLPLALVRDRVDTRYDGTSETFTVAARSIGNGGTVAAVLNYIEYR